MVSAMPMQRFLGYLDAVRNAMSKIFSVIPMYNEMDGWPYLRVGSIVVVLVVRFLLVVVRMRLLVVVVAAVVVRVGVVLFRCRRSR